MRVEGVGEKIICTGLGCVTENKEGNCHYSEGGEGGKLANFTFGCSFGHFFWQICYFHDRISSFASMVAGREKESSGSVVAATYSDYIYLKEWATKDFRMEEEMNYGKCKMCHQTAISWLLVLPTTRDVLSRR